MKKLLLCLFLAGCGAAGAPEAPTPTPGLTLSGEVTAGIGGGL